MITLLSDLGTQDTYIADIKILLAQHTNYNNIIDISHHLVNDDIRHGAYLTMSAYRHFPAGGVHIIMVGILNQSRQKLLLTEHQGHYFIAPDNGVLPLALGNDLQNMLLCREFDAAATYKDWINEISTLIQGLQTNGLPLGTYPPYPSYQAYAPNAPMMFNNRVDCSILHIDRYGNIAINISKEQFYGFIGEGKFSIKILRAAEEINTVSQNYNEVPEGKYLCRFNGSGFLEIAVNRSGEGMAIAGKKNYQPDINYDKISINLYA